MSKALLSYDSATLSIEIFVRAHSGQRCMLWCYFIWYLVTVVEHFDPSPRLWLSSLGISAIVGLALHLSIQNEAPTSSNRWQTFRLFLMPFCVSSFSALINGQRYILVLPSRPVELGLSVALCAIFVLFVLGLKATQRGFQGGR